MSALYTTDILGNGFEQLCLNMPNDYEGEVVCTLVRKCCSAPSTKAALYIHGFNDYFFQQELADKFIEQGYNFYAIELRKCGRSILPHQRAYNLRNVKEYFEDLDAAIAQIKSEGCANLTILGHSTGGLIASLYLVQRTETCQALILNSPFLEMNKTRMLRKLGIPLVSLLSYLFPNMPLKSKFSSFYGESLHGSKRGEWEYNLAWKPIRCEQVTASWVRGISKAHKAVQRGLDIQCPILVLSSDKSMKGSVWTDDFHRCDLVLNVEHIWKFADKLGRQVSKVQLAGAKHDLFLSQKPARLRAYETMFQWLNRPTSAK